MEEGMAGLSLRLADRTRFVMVKGGGAVLASEEVEPSAEIVIPEVGISLRLGPSPVVIPEPKPQATRTIGVRVGPAQLGVVNPFGVFVPAEGS